ncbi:hypothetical protein I3843_01G286900 [Carya illinoinensis]|uniref:Flocculation protein n=1 Tax=Carya illinoinensis TaxID=32201 RepID=A0A8T1RSQ4_CARIL|nr:uncharacterized protein LOC122291822 isoform X1 [Carya illinoinensis]KAG2730446.1 hypothetical protein I3760_01G292700 [Carya illinoinensis]KAG6670217.1 hypothetical protein CIPAW_01G295700 [Carya illinoinensis]KAG7999056.1 hypothetical protein I3843_01G286900 [Carya illinoinensis]
MSDSTNHDSTRNDKIEDLDRSNRYDVEDFDDSSSMDALSSCDVGSVASSSGSRESGGSTGEIGLTDRLTDVLVDGGDGDLLLQQNDREDRVLQWLQALDMQVMGACRADERLKPLLKTNASNGVAEDRLLAHLSQNFEPAEVGMLARCFCIPLVSLRVGKISRQGNQLCPTGTRGNLNLAVLPTSDLRLSFTGDDGLTERLFTISKSQCASVEVDEIPADNSGRSFHIKIPEGQVFYFWCSEKSKLLGMELLAKMRDLLKRKPSIAELTGICESRLSCFATHLRAYLVATVGSSRTSSPGSPITSLGTTAELFDTSQNGLSSSMSTKSLRSRHSGSQAAKANSFHQGSLSPRSSSFKEGLPRNLSSLRSAAREKLRRRADGHVSAVDNLTITSSTAFEASSSNNCASDNLPEVTRNMSYSPLSFLESLGKLAAVPALSPTTQISCVGSPIFSPYYCWCPPGMPTVQFSAAPQQIPVSSNESLPFPSLSSLLPNTMPSSLLTSTPPLGLDEASTVNFPALRSDQLVRLPIQTSQQIRTFTPLMCDPIVHIPVIDVCSSGQGYLVSAGPAISNVIPPLHPKLVNPLIPETDTMVEKGARETLRLLISGSSQTNPPLMEVLPAVLTKADQNQGMLLAGSRGLYSGTTDVGVIASGIAAISLASLSGRSGGGSYENMDIKQAGSSCLGGSFSDDEGTTSCSNCREETD